MAEKGLTKAQIVSNLTRSPHGNLSEYVPVAKAAVAEDPEFYAHLVAWNHAKGQVRDAKAALPIVALFGNDAFHDNALAHLAALDPRTLDKALVFAKEQKAGSRLVRRLVERYLRDLEARGDGWDDVALYHRRVLQGLYARYHVKPAERAANILFNNAPVGKFGVLKQLSTLAPIEAAGAIIANKIPFLIARGAMGKRLKDPDVLMALIKRMTPTELVTNTKALENLGVKETPALRAAFEEALAKAAKSKKATLKTSQAAASLTDATLKTKLKATQEKQLDAISITGRWLVLGDCSGSMAACIEAARRVAAMLARVVKEEVHLVFFNTTPKYYNATGKTYEEITAETKHVMAGGGTAIGCGLRYLLEKKIDVDGIAIVSDGGDNTPPWFAETFKGYTEKTGLDPAVYFYHLPGEQDHLSVECNQLGVEIQKFELPANVDYYSLPNLVLTMRPGRYALLDEIMETPLKTLDQVLRNTKGTEVIRHGDRNARATAEV